MAQTTTSLLGKLIKTSTFEDNTCIPDTLEKLLDVLVDRLSIELPTSIFDVLITVSVTAPSDKTKLWLATDTSGSVISLRKFVADAWQEVYPLSLGMLGIFEGNPSAFSVEGWAVADGTNGTPDTQDRWSTLPSGSTLFYAQYIR